MSETSHPEADPLAVSDGPPPAAIPVADTPVDLTGKSLGDYLILRKLGQGGMGQVYLARQQSLKREVALKLLRNDLNANSTALKRFQAEAEAVARVNHANIVQVYAIGEHDGLRYMALEYVDGRNLREYLARKGPPELPVALLIMRQIAAALQRASELGIVHRDIKPENILLTRKVEVKVTDFGLSRYFAGAETAQPAANLTQSGVTLGTPLYMSPEQVKGLTVDHRSDIYSFGVTCFHLLAGQPPFHGATAFEVAVQHVQNEPPSLASIRPDLPPDLCALVHKMMAKKPDDRYQTARDVIRDLAKIQRGLAGVVGASLSGTSLGESGTRLGSAVTQSGLPSVSSPILVPTGQSSQSGTAFAGLVTTGMTVALPPSPPGGSGARWIQRIAGLVIVGSLGGVGWWAFGKLGATPPPPTTEPTPITGLPDVKPPTRVITSQERSLVAKWENPRARPADTLDAGIALGLFYVRERRLDDAEKIFKEVELKRIDWTSDIARDKLNDWLKDLPKKIEGAGAIRRLIGDSLGEIPGKLGRAIVLAHRDQHVASIEMFSAVVQELDRKPFARGKQRHSISEMLTVEFLRQHPDLAQAISVAMNRNADNLKAKVPEKLEWMLTPTGLARGPR